MHDSQPFQVWKGGLKNILVYILDQLTHSTMTEDGLICALYLPMHCAACRAHRSEQSTGKAGAQVPSGEDTLPDPESQTGACQVKAPHSGDPLRVGVGGWVGTGGEGLGERQMPGPGAGDSQQYPHLEEVSQGWES